MKTKTQTVEITGDEWTEYRRLRASASDLLEAAKLADILFDRMFRLKALSNSEHEDWGKIRAAIARAEGDNAQFKAKWDKATV